MNQSTTNRVMRLKEVLKICQLGRSTLYDKINPKSPRYDKDFPKPIRLGSNSVGWINHEIDNWLQSKMAQR